MIEQPASIPPWTWAALPLEVPSSGTVQLTLYSEVPDRHALRDQERGKHSQLRVDTIAVGSPD